MMEGEGLAENGSQDSAERSESNISSGSCSQWWNPVAWYLTFRSRKIVTVEPVYLLFVFGLNMAVFTINEQYVFNRYGRDEFALHNESRTFNACLNADILDKSLGNRTGDFVSKETAFLAMIVAVTSKVPAVIPALFYGGWSDRIGRKPIMLITSFCACLRAALTLTLVYLNLNVYLLILAASITSFTGSFPGMTTATYSYIADVSSKRWRTFRIGILESMIFIGAAIALGATGVMLRADGCHFEHPVWLYLACNIAILIYILVYLPESLPRRERQVMTSAGVNFFSGIKVFTSSKYSRWRLWFTVFQTGVFYLTYIGFTSVSPLYLLHKPLSWTPFLIGIYLAVSEISHGLSLLFILPALTSAGLPDALISLIGEVFAVAGLISTPFVTTTWQMFLVGALQGIESIARPPLRSIMSRAVSKDDQGSIFSVMAAMQMVASTVSSLLFNLFYGYSLQLGWPAGTIYFLIGAIAAIPAPFSLILFLLRNRPGAVYSSDVGEEDKEEEVEQSVEEPVSLTDSEDAVFDEHTSILATKRASARHHCRSRTSYGSNRKLQYTRRSRLIGTLFQWYCHSRGATVTQTN